MSKRMRSARKAGVIHFTRPVDGVTLFDFVGLTWYEIVPNTYDAGLQGGDHKSIGQGRIIE